MNKVVFLSPKPSDTIRLGKMIGRLLNRGDVVALIGELGAGKTQLIKGLAQGAGVSKSTYVSSPSFTLINEYKGEIPFYHIDLYRLGEEKEAEGLGLEDYFQGEGITAVEWADRIPSLLPEELLNIHIYYTGKKTRSIEMVAKGEKYKDLMTKFGVRSQEFGVKY
ncbi:MAG: tRNA (adenosine(37)-N6)-threonylcarbamoyltransferase complex ATPase subunit type 1 TsaE [Deltaproteobacteria bacterium]|nr:tRNA (adenosine(37)-N6)-threonylcarbamoyltransferase complex ATPase subunit type 1 TsaE [Deltaproteobacteria bacterium]